MTNTKNNQANSSMKISGGTAVLAMCLCAGGVISPVLASDESAAIPVSTGEIVPVAHIYFNVASGERVVTLDDANGGDGQTAGTDNALSGPIWTSLTNTLAACPVLGGPGFTTSFFYVADDNSGTTPFSTGVTTLDWGDIELDTVVDCVQINWITDHDDVDMNSDGIGDGVGGLAGQWTWFDADNGRQLNISTRLPLISIIFTNLPGDTSGTQPGDPGNTLAGYTADVDLASVFSGTSLTFEIGDSDGDLQGAAFGHNDVDTDGDGIGDGVSVANADRDFDGIPDGDLDSDALFDWSWGVRFFQPGTADLDGDGQLDGDFADSMRIIGLPIASPEGEPLEVAEGVWQWIIDTSAIDAGTGAEDFFAIYADGVFAGRFNFGDGGFAGFSCTPDENGFGTPRADFAHVLYGPSGFDCCPADTNCDGELNFFDITGFLSAFNAMDPSADINGDGLFNFFDVSDFLMLFAQGCP